jgi:hypothetical protein
LKIRARSNFSSFWFCFVFFVFCKVDCEIRDDWQRIPRSRAYCRLHGIWTHKKNTKKIKPKGATNITHLQGRQTLLICNLKKKKRKKKKKNREKKMGRPRVVLATLSGASCSGKTTLARRLLSAGLARGLAITVVSHDDFYRSGPDFDWEAAEAFDAERLAEAVRGAMLFWAAGDNGVGDDSARDESVRDHSTQNDSSQDPSTQYDSSQDHSTQNDSTQNDSSQDPSTQYDSSQDHSARNCSAGAVVIVEGFLARTLVEDAVLPQLTMMTQHSGPQPPLLPPLTATDHLQSHSSRKPQSQPSRVHQSQPSRKHQSQPSREHQSQPQPPRFATLHVRVAVARPVAERRRRERPPPPDDPLWLPESPGYFAAQVWPRHMAIARAEDAAGRAPDLIVEDGGGNDEDSRAQSVDAILDRLVAALKI